MSNLAKSPKCETPEQSSAKVMNSNQDPMTGEKVVRELDPTDRKIQGPEKLIRSTISLNQTNTVARKLVYTPEDALNEEDKHPSEGEDFDSDAYLDDDIDWGIPGLMNIGHSNRIIHKQYWTKEEDLKLQALVEKYGAKNWKRIASYF